MLVHPLVACGAYTALYVSALYALPALYDCVARAHRPAARDCGRDRDRDHPAVIVRRLAAALTATGACLVLAGAYLHASGALHGAGLWRALDALRRLGMRVPAPSLLHGRLLPLEPVGPYLCEAAGAAALGAGVTALPYAGALYADVRARAWRRRPHGSRLQFVRNIVVGPATEELVFRACMIATLAAGGASRAACILVPPLFFGAAHVHHARETYAAYGRTRRALRTAVATAAAQFAYTSAFGWYAGYLFVRTQSVLAPLAAHMVCNGMGLPVPGRSVTERALQLVGTALFVLAITTL